MAIKAKTKPQPEPPVPSCRRAGATTQNLPMQVRAAPIRPGSLDEEARTVELVWSTGAPVRRVDWWTGERYDEILSMDSAHVDLARLNNGAPLLNTHGQWNLEDVIGVVEKAWLADGEGRALVRFSQREDVGPIFGDVRAGIIRNVSVGYTVRKFEITEEDGKPPIYRAVDWEPCEISMVPVGADAAAGTRAQPAADGPPCIFETRAPARTEDSDMDPKTKKAGDTSAEDDGVGGEDARATETAATVAEAERRGAAAERARAKTIRQRVTAVQLPADVAEDLIERGVSVDRVGDAIVDEIAHRGGARPALPSGGIEGGPDHTDPAAIRGRMVEALAARATAHLPSAARFEMSEAGRAFAHHSILDLCADLARARGEKIERHLRGAALYNVLLGVRALSTSDFPYLLADAGNKIMGKAYQLATPTYRLIFARKTFNDFKAHKFIRSGDFPVPLEKGEKGEFQYGSMGEAKQELTLATYGRVIGLSRRVLVNDDLQAFATIPLQAARRTADFENATAWAVVTSNSGNGPTIAETGRALFNTTDKTKAASGGAIDVANVGAGRAAMMKQTSIDGLKLNIEPRYLVTSPDQYTTAESFCAVNIVATKDSDTNPFKGKLQPVGEANLSGNAWHLFAEAGQIETLVYGHLEGAEGPQLSTREGFTTDGVELRVMLDFVAGAIDFRGAYKNPQS